MGEARPDDSQFCDFPFQNGGFGQSCAPPALWRLSLRRLRLVKDAKFEDSCIRTGAHPGNPGLEAAEKANKVRLPIRERSRFDWVTPREYATFSTRFRASWPNFFVITPLLMRKRTESINS